MTLVHLDILTPKQVMLMQKVKCELEDRGLSVLITTRRYREVNELLALKRLEAVEVGEHGGRDLYGKADASLKRSVLMLELLRRHGPRVSASFSSPEAARASFGLGIPHICISDSPHARAVSLLTVPLSAKLLTPNVIPKSAWTRLGVCGRNIIHYRALDPAAWLKSFKPDETILNALGLSRTLPIVTVRLEETQAAYLLEQTAEQLSVIEKAISRISKLHGGKAQVVLLPRYGEQVERLKRGYGKNVVVAERVVDGPSLLHHSAVFLGGGGTMTAEAALMGIPTYSCYPSRPTYVDRFLMRSGLMKRVSSVERLVKEVQSLLDHPDKHRRLQERKARQLLARMENPAERIAETIMALC